MNKILIWRQIESGSDIDIFNKTDYTSLDSRIQELYAGVCPNWGNKLWFQGLYSEIDTPENIITVRTNESISEINSNYDLIIWPMANFFSVEFASDTSEHINTLKQITIPVYIIACGVQATHYNELDMLIDKIGISAGRFIEAIYSTGGEFALRGFFTKEFFDKLGFSNAVVTGCPSMYQMGRDFKISDNKVDYKDIKPIITGRLSLFENIMKSISQSVYLSQELYEEHLYRKNYLNDKSIKKDYQFYSKYSIYQAHLLGEGRIKMICDTKDWFHYIRNNNFNFAFGTKIHGSIMPILAGVPAMLISVDTRTQEMAEFFDIPSMYIGNANEYTTKQFYDAYDQTDYSKFNARYKERFLNYEQFLTEHGIVKKINDHNSFFANSGENEFDHFLPNKESFIAFEKRLNREKILHKSIRKIKQFKTHF